MEAKTEAEQLKECKEAFHALKDTFNALLKEARTKTKTVAEQIKASKEAFDELLKAHQGLLRHSGHIAVGYVSLNLERLKDQVEKRFAELGHDPRITPLIERADSLEARMASIEISQKRNRTTYRDIRDAQTRLEAAVSELKPATPPAHVPDEFDLQADQRESQPDGVDYQDETE